MNKILIVYFSHRGENYWNGGMKVLTKGNTEIAAEMIAKITGGDLFEVETVRPYSEHYRECVQEAREEFMNQTRPALKTYPDGVEDYDTIFVGYPNWCGTMPMAMFTFLEHYDWSGKRVLPFCTNEGSGMGRSVADLKKICPGALVEDGLPVHGAETADSFGMIEAWVQKNLTND